MPGAIVVDIKIDTRQLEALYRSAPEIDATICELAVEHIWTEARRRAPVDTGYLRDHITKIATGNVFKVLSEAPYSIYQEFGTRYQSAQPFLRPAFESVKWIPLLRQALRKHGW